MNTFATPLSRTGVYGIALQDQKLLVVKQQKGPHAGKFDLPGGGIEFGETIEGALRREFCEEVGMTFNSIQFMENITATTGTFYQIGLIYLIKGLSPLTNSTPEMEYFWLDLDSLSDSTMAPLARQMLPKVKEASAMKVDL